jgi:hypothetical protein
MHGGECASGALPSGVISEMVRVVHGLTEDGCREWVGPLPGEKLIIDVLF